MIRETTKKKFYTEFTEYTEGTERGPETHLSQQCALRTVDRITGSTAYGKLVKTKVLGQSEKRLTERQPLLGARLTATICC